MDYRPQTAAPVRYAELWTFQDAINHVLDAFDAKAVFRELRAARRAVYEAYRDLPTHHAWSYYLRRWQLTTFAAQSNGTVEYDHSGRTLTISGGTWPASARRMRIIIDEGSIDEGSYPIESRVNGTVLTLPEDQNPGADVAATTYTLYQSEYPLPVGARRLGLPRSHCEWFLDYASAEEAAAVRQGNWHPQTPWLATIRSSGESYGEMVLELSPPPAQAKTYHFVYEASPQPLVWFGTTAEFTTGTVSSSGTTITGDGTDWTSNMVGCVLRVSDTGEPPTGLVGTNERDNPYTEQRIVQSVESATSLTIDQAFSGSHSDVPYSIGSPLDVEPHTMLTYLLRLAEHRYAVNVSHESQRQRFENQKLALREAMAKDSTRMQGADMESSGFIWILVK